MDDKADLLAFARESASSGADLYELLGVDTSTSREDIHRAWRRQGLKYHPDKAGANYDATLYERFAHARDVLVDDAARKVYDTAREAAAQKRRQTEQMSAERRRFKDELEAAERAQAGTAMSGEAPFASSGQPLSSEREKLREAGRRRAEERQRREQETHDKLRQKEDNRIAEIEQRLREKEDKARRRAEKKAARKDGEGNGAKSATSKPEQAAASASAPDGAEWRKLVSSTSDSKKEGPVEHRPLFAYTMDRLKAAGDTQRRQKTPESNMTALPPPFEPLWDEIDDPEVHKFIKRVPRFAKAPSAPPADVPMDMTA